MAKLIDADVLKECIISPRCNGKSLLMSLIDSIPTIDAVQVIRCKKCRWFINKECAIYCLSSAHEETFCSYAEPKETDSDETD